MRVLFIVPYPTSGPSNRFRVEQYLPYLEGRRVSYCLRPFCNPDFYLLLRKRGHYFKKAYYLLVFLFSRFVDLLRVPYYDIVFIHREAFPAKDYIFEWLFRIFSRRLVYDFDDAIFLKKPAKTRAIIRLSDHIIAGNGFLKSYAASLNNAVTILPTCIDTGRYRPIEKKCAGEKIVIGWMGTATTSEYLGELRNVFKFILDKYGNVEIRIVGGMSEGFLGPGLVYKNWFLDSEILDLQEFDIGIMPMPDSDWTKGKCAFKIIQYMAVGIPSVAAPVGMNLEVIRHGVNGFFASGEKEWIDRLSRLIEDAALRGEIGKNGRRTIEERYALKIAEPRFVGILEQTLSKR